MNENLESPQVENNSPIEEFPVKTFTFEIGNRSVTVTYDTNTCKVTQIKDASAPGDTGEWDLAQSYSNSAPESHFLGIVLQRLEAELKPAEKERARVRKLLEHTMSKYNEAA